MNYILSSRVNLSFELVDEVATYYLEVDTKKDKIFKINKTIYEFTNCFNEATTFKSILKKYQDNLEVKNKDSFLILENSLQGFFNQLIAEGVLVKEGKIESIFSKTFLFEKNKQIGVYKITELIANNRITDVYLVKSKKAFFVIKLLNYSKIRSVRRLIKYQNIFKLEHSFVQKFNSKYINKTYGYYSTDNFDYIVLEYVKGLSIYKFIKNNRPKIKERENLILEILKAFSVVHNKNVYHGDIHFGNILVTENGKIKIIDFGLSNNVETSDLELKYKIKKRNGGVHYFIPPERLIKDGNFKKKFTRVTAFNAEVYQIGLICYYILFYKEVFNSETWKEHIQDKLNFNIERDRNFVNRKRFTKFHELIIKSLNTDPNKRFHSAIEMLKFVTNK